MGLIRILVLIGLGLIAYSVYRRMVAPHKKDRATREDERLGRLMQDPQCGVWVDGKAAIRRKVAGGELFFCSEDCADAHLGDGQGKPQAEEASPPKE